MRIRALLLLTLLLPIGGAADESCESVAQRLSVLGLEGEARCSSSSAKQLNNLLSRVPPDDCNVMAACSASEAGAQCTQGIRKLLERAADKIGGGDVSWAHLSASLVQYTDGEATAELLTALSYLLPERPDVLSDVIDQNPHIKRWTRSIVDPVPDLRDIDDRCAYFSDIASSISGSHPSDTDEEIVHWATESYELYQCD